MIRKDVRVRKGKEENIRFVAVIERSMDVQKLRIHQDITATVKPRLADKDVVCSLSSENGSVHSVDTRRSSFMVRFDGECIEPGRYNYSIETKAPGRERGNIIFWGIWDVDTEVADD